ncbi:DUF222 domain-containing protein [Microbacterium sp.]|uniref:HNH endonuclease signature motif containing protein n=1 Tax=Microbacterium sp. TaxID=51671 RepID=UPI00324241A1
MTEIAPGGVIETDSGGRFVAVLSGLVADTEAVARAVTAAQVAEVRVLARAGQLAEREAAAQRGSVREHDMVLRSIAAELGGVLRVTDRTVQQRIGEARGLVESYPATLDAWEGERITRGHVRVIVDAGGLVPAERRAEFEAEAIRLCEGDTPNRVRAAVEILAERTAERSFTERHRTASACRRVRVIPGADGMSDLVATVPTVIAHGILDRLTQQAMVIADSRHHEGDGVGDGDGDGDTRTMDQIRADALSDMLLTGSPTLDPSAVGDRPGALGAIRAQVQVIVPALTLLDADDGPADLGGRTPVDADTARALAANAPTLTRILTGPVDGTVIAVDRYRTAQSQRRFLRARDQHCRFPGCRRAAIRCEIDHTVDHAQGGPTALWNLAHLCQRHHSMKQFTSWRVRQHPGGILEWTSPTGRTYREDAPVLPVAFVVTAAPSARPAPAEPPPF